MRLHFYLYEGHDIHPEIDRGPGSKTFENYCSSVMNFSGRNTYITGSSHFEKSDQ